MAAASNGSIQEWARAGLQQAKDRRDLRDEKNRKDALREYPDRANHPNRKVHNGMNEGRDYAPHRFGADENDLD